MNDGMRPYDPSNVPYGWTVDFGGSWNSNGDIGSVSAVGYSRFLAEGIINGKTLSTDSYPYLVSRGRAIHGGSWAVGIIDTTDSEYLFGYYSNTIWDTKSISLPSGKSIKQFVVRSWGTIQVDYLAVSSLPVSFLKPLYMEVNRNITEEFDTARLELDYQDVKSIEDNLGGSHIKIWLAKDTLITDNSFKKVFTGQVEKIRKVVEGHTPRKLEVEAFGYGKYLSQRIIRQGKVFEGPIDQIARGIVDDLVDEGLITTKGISSFTDATRKVIKSSTSIQETLAELAEDYDAEYFVDFGGDLNFFKKGTRVNTIQLDIDETTEFPYEEDYSNIINAQEVMGIDEDTRGSDTAWSDSLTNWIGSGSLSLSSKIIDPDASGSYSIRNTMSTSGTMWFARDMGTIDLSLGGVLHYSLQIRCPVPSDKPAPKLRTKTYFISKNGTVTIETEASGGLSAERTLPEVDEIGMYKAIPQYYYFYYPMAKFEVPFSYKLAMEADTNGTIDWDEINTIKIEVSSPTISPVGAIAWLDNVYIDQVPYYGYTEDQASIQKYGKREGIPFIDRSLDSNTKCQFLSSLIVATYKDPVRIIEDVKTIRNFEFNPGDECTLSVKEMQSIPVILRSVRHEVEGLNFDTYLTFSERYIPEPERLFAIAKKQLEAFAWDIEAWKNARFAPTGVIPTRSERLDFWEAKNEFAMFSFTQSRALLALGESDAGWEIADSTNANLKVGLLELWTPPNYDTPETLVVNTLRISDRVIENTLLAATAKIMISGSSFELARYYIGDLTDAFGFRFDTINVGSSSVRVLGQTRVNGTPYSIVLDTIPMGEIHWFDMRYDKPRGTVYFYIDRTLKGYLSQLPTTSTLAPIFVDIQGWDISNTKSSTITFRGWELGEPWW